MAGARHRGGARRRAWLKVLALVALVVAANLLVEPLSRAIDFELRPSNEDAAHRAIMLLAVAYTALMALPFVPGVEIGLGLIAVLGPPIVALVYACTVVALSVSFLVGRLVPPARLARLLDDLGLARASALLRRLQPMDLRERLAFLVGNAPHRLLPVLLEHRYLALAVAVNLPGNFLLGGGGGIAMVAGVSGLYSVPGFVVTIVLAVAPLPLAILVLGKQVLAG